MGIMVDIVGAKRENLYLLPMVGNEQISFDFYSAIESFVKTLHENYFEQLSSLLTFRFEVFDSSDFY